jgi:DNA-directed RNA polymerase subunit beta'
VELTGESETKIYQIPYGSRIRVSVDQQLEAGEELTEGSVDPKEMLRVKGLQGVQNYLLREVQRVYRLQGVDINDKHVEVMIRQMLRKVRILDAGDTELLPGTYVDLFSYENANRHALLTGKVPAVARPALLGITKASLETDSFLSAASFQETTRVLTEAAIKGKVDRLLGLKENVIIGKLIPAGTGMSRYRNVSLPGEEEEQSANADSSAEFEAEPAPTVE